MRIDKLHFKNLNSLKGEFFIDFTSPPFAEAGLFAVTGPTGAGKSTIFDALALGLYGETPRLQKRRAGGEGIFEIVSRHTAEAWAEVEFVVPSGRYRSRWEAHRARGSVSGAFQPPRMGLVRLDPAGDELIEDKLSEVPERISLLSGLDFTRFTRSVLLAQGAFAKFLQAPSAERAELLEKMTGSRIYSEVSRLAFERARDEELGLKQLQNQLDEIALLSELESEEAAGLLESREAQYRDALKARDRLLSQRETVMRFAALARERAILAESRAEQALRATKIDEQRQRLQRHELAEPRRGEFEQLQQLEKERQEGRFQIESISAAIAELQSEAEESSRREAGLQQREQTARAQLEQQQRTAGEAERTQTLLRERGSRLEGLDLELGGIADNLAGLEKEERRNAAVREELATEREKFDAVVMSQGLAALSDSFEMVRLRNAERIALADQIEARQAELEQLQTETMSAPQDPIEAAKRDQAVEKKQALSSIEERLAGLKTREELETGLGLLDERRNQLQLLEPLAESLKVRGKELSERRRREMELEEELRTVHDLARQLAGKVEESRHRFLESALTDLRGRLKQGNPCPVCGSKEHPALLQADLFTPENVQVESLPEEQYREVLLRQRTLEEQLDARRIRSQELAEEIAEYEERLAAADWRPELYAEVQAERSAKADALNARSDLEKRRSELLVELEAQHAERARWDAELSRLQSEQVLSEERRRSISEEIRRAEERRAGFLEEIGPLCRAAGLDPDHPDLERQAAEMVEDFRAARERIDVLKDDERDARMKLERISEERQRLQAESGKIGERRQGVADELDELNRELFGLTGGRDLGAYAEECRREVTDAVAALEDERIRGSEVREQLAARRGTLSGLEESVRQYREKMEKLQESLTRFAAGHGFASLEECRAAILPDAAVMRNEIIVYDRELEKLGTRMAEIDAELAERDSSLPPPEELESHIEEAEGLFVAAQQARTEAQRVLETDRHNRARRDELRGEIERRRQEYLVWWRLKELIGSARGDSFRRFAQGLTLDYLVSLANRHLRRFSGRYRLKRREGEELSMEIVDTWQADTVRPVETLSGGETFLVSLSLALGLSELAGRKTRIDSLFLDEGFGTLDAETLETVLSALETLRSSGKLIGIISHVEALKDRIQVQIQVQRRGTGYSAISVVPEPV